MEFHITERAAPSPGAEPGPRRRLRVARRPPRPRGEPPLENYAALRDAGFYALNVPTDLGGAGVGLLGYSLAAEELAQGCASTALSFNMHLSIVGPLMESPIVPADTKKRVARMVVHDGKLIAGNYSEPTTSGLVGHARAADARPARGRRLPHHRAQGLRVDARGRRLLRGDGVSGRGDLADGGHDPARASPGRGTARRRGVGHAGDARDAQRLHGARRVLGRRRRPHGAGGRHRPVSPRRRQLVVGLLHRGLSRDRRRGAQGPHRDRAAPDAARLRPVPRLSSGRAPAAWRR